MTLNKFKVADINELFDHIGVIHEDNERLFKENGQLKIELNELKETLVRLEQNNADKDVHVIQMHKDLDRLDEIIDIMKSEVKNDYR